MRTMAAGFEVGNAASVTVDDVCVDDVTLRSDEENEARYACLPSDISRRVDEDNGRR